MDEISVYCANHRLFLSYTISVSYDVSKVPLWFVYWGRGLKTPYVGTSCGVAFKIFCVYAGEHSFLSLFVFLTSSSAPRLYRGGAPILTSDNFMCCHTETGRGDQSQYSETDPTSRERAPGAGIEATTS